MIYEKMIQSENSDQMRDAWSEYRAWMTDYVYNCVENYYRRAYLAASGKLREQSFSLRKYLAENNKKPVIAVWGAGRCNDLDLAEFADIAKLVLIDRETEWIGQAKKKYALTDAQCICVDLGFWEIYEEEEQYFEKLVIEGDEKHLCLYLQQLQDSIIKQGTDFSEYENLFDFSVVCGVASQLNARLASLLHIYTDDAGKLKKVEEYLSEMNRYASANLFHAVSKTTKHAVVCANELCADAPGRAAVLQEYAQQWTEDAEERISTKKETAVYSACKVAGSREFIQEMEQAQQDGVLRIGHRCGAIWPFSKDKYYLMDVLTAQFINKIKNN